VGALVVNFLKTIFTTGFLAPYWLFLLGGLFIGVTLLLPKGIVGTVEDWLAARRARKAAGNGPATDPASQPAE
jgi:urea transport system permease protein